MKNSTQNIRGYTGIFYSVEPCVADTTELTKSQAHATCTEHAVKFVHVVSEIRVRTVNGQTNRHAHQSTPLRIYVSMSIAKGSHK